MGTLITIDPGASMGVAVWDGSKLVFVGQALPRVASRMGAQRVIIERPVARWKGSVEDIATLAIRANKVGGATRERWPGIVVDYIDPTAWKGTMAKVHVPARCREVLMPEELAIPVRTADQWDAIGIGLWALGRWPRKKILT